MSKRLYCGNLPYAATADDVRALFVELGMTVTDVHVVMDRETGRSRGFAFVEVSTEEEAAAAIRGLDGKTYSGRPLTVKEAREREPRLGGFGGPRPGGRQQGGFRGGPPRGPMGRQGEFGGGRERPPSGPAYPLPEFEPPAPPPALDYAPADDGDYRDRSDRGRRGRDRRGGRRKGEDFGGEGW